MTQPETTRRDFLRDGTLAAGLVGVAAAAAAAEPPAKRPEEHKHPAHHGEYPRDHAGPGGPVGSDTDRGKLVPGWRAVGEPPVPVVTPDLPRLPWKLVNGVKEFHLVARHTRREFLPGAWMDVWGYNDSMPG